MGQGIGPRKKTNGNKQPNNHNRYRREDKEEIILQGDQGNTTTTITKAFDGQFGSSEAEFNQYTLHLKLQDEAKNLQAENKITAAKADEEAEEALYWKYLPLYKAAQSGNWESANEIINKDPEALKAKITNLGETALHVAVTIGEKSIDFVNQIVNSNSMSKEALELTDDEGYTALHSAAWFGNTDATRHLVEQNKAYTLLYICHKKNYWLPVHRAAAGGHKDTLFYLLEKTKHDHPVFRVTSSNLNESAARGGGVEVFVDDEGKPHMPFANQLGAELLVLLISSEFYDISVKLEEDHHHNRPDVENQINNDQQNSNQTQVSRGNFWISGLGCFKSVREKKLMHHEAHQLVKHLCEQIKSSKQLKTYRSLAKIPFLEAASSGIREIVVEILYSFPRAIGATYKDCNIFEISVINRQENIFNLLHEMGGYKQSMTRFIDVSDNNILHLAARLSPLDKLNRIPGAALQMQRELQWFEEVKKIVTPSYIDSLNKDGDTPAMVFREEHKKLVEEGGQWMKNTANSCTIVAALIVTVVFAAAITVPGGNDSTSGLPMLSKQVAFIIFAVSDAISLFTSITSLLIFLYILTSRYAESDFLYVLPRMLIMGLLTLFLSITTMILAFSCILYLVFGHEKPLILVPVAVLACLPVTCFIFFQFPLLVDLISSTYCRGIFSKKSGWSF